jgi:hypothetical protein
MTAIQARELVVRMYRKHGGGSPQHIKALKRYNKIANLYSEGN